ncbi:MAG: lipid-A-disaccharide synthase [Sphingomonadales bacterium]|nr:lipid-A-disaccharide synthase [Sphingomonadales bacterium]
MKYYLIAGEASGDLHGGRLIRELKKQQPQAKFRAWGGDFMQEHGAEIMRHYRDLAFMGFVEVLRNLPAIWKNFRFCQSDIQQFQPDVVVLIDYPGFNMRLLPFLKKNGIKVVWYISPQLWAWNASRVKQIKKYVDVLLCILPFEKDWYAKHSVAAQFVGHPLLDALDEMGQSPDFPQRHNLKRDGYLALLPGSRTQEIRKILPSMLQTAARFPDYPVVIAQAPNQPAELYHSFSHVHPFTLMEGRTYEVLRNARAALVASGTATLETALVGCPMLVAYKGSAISYAIGKRLVKVPFISLVNLIARKELVYEFIQNNCSPEHMTTEANRLLHDPIRREELKQGYMELRESLGGLGASQRAADAIIKSCASQ